MVPKLPRLPKLIAVALVLGALVYTLVAAMLVLVAVGFAGIGALVSRPLEFALVLLLAGSPVVVWTYCLKKARGWLRGETPRT
ncbi:hypothetical protein MTR62_06315 [Novosphingobium sp. 1949]|uniref:DUF2842 domain-containing protein n=1 Tax=Novosphingobium organovorum TaxID=2930092 RepID=A0ABT0BB85_9SPHN|nr:hypothetical protein [Novosphingobium organovorum]MCJ2182315.1 hypothetical protein [Novosphingobium organovorum]